MRRNVLLGCMAALLIVWIGRDALDPFNDASFDSSKWLQGNLSRMPMAGDVVELSRRSGMTAEKVIGLLGPPDYELVGQTSDTGGNPLLGSRCLVYVLGSNELTSFRGMDDAFVYIHLNDDDSIVDAEITGY